MATENTTATTTMATGMAMGAIPTGMDTVEAITTMVMAMGMMGGTENDDERAGRERCEF